MLPSIASEALAMSRDVDCTAVQFCNIVKRDISLATEMLTLANSAMFCGGSSISNLHDAIVRIGFKDCRNLIICSSTMSLMKKMPLDDRNLRKQLWKHSFATAATCSLLNRLLNLGYQGEEFSAGLLHDFGRFLLAIAAKDNFHAADSMDFCEHGDVLQHERSVLGTDHCQFGAWFAEKSELPPCLVDSIRWHHQLETDNPNRKLIALVATADHVANFVHQESDASKYDPLSNAGLIKLDDCTNTNIVDLFSSAANELIAEIKNAI